MRFGLKSAVLVATLLASQPAFCKTQAPWSEGICRIQPFSGKAFFKPSHEVVYDYSNRAAGRTETMSLYLKPGETPLDVSCSRQKTIVVTNQRILFLAGGEDIFFSLDSVMDNTIYEFGRPAKSAVVANDGTIFVLDNSGSLYSYKQTSEDRIAINHKATLGIGSTLEVKGATLFGIAKTGKTAFVCEIH